MTENSHQFISYIPIYLAYHTVTTGLKHHHLPESRAPPTSDYTEIYHSFIDIQINGIHQEISNHQAPYTGKNPEKYSWCMDLKCWNPLAYNHRCFQPCLLLLQDLTWSPALTPQMVPTMSGALTRPHVIPRPNTTDGSNHVWCSHKTSHDPQT